MIEEKKERRGRFLAGLAGGAIVTGGALVLGQRRILANQAKLLTKIERVEAIKAAIKKTQAEQALQRAAKSAERKAASVLKKKGESSPRPAGQAQHTGGKKRKLKNFIPVSHVNPKDYGIGLSRLVKLIELDTLNITRDNGGKFAGSGGPLTDPAAMQAAYLLPRMNGSSPVMQSPRGRGRPPGALNKSTIMRQQAEQAVKDDDVVIDAAQQQPEFKAEVAARQESSLLKKAVIGAGIAAGGALVIGPRIAKSVGQAVAESKGVARVAGKLGSKINPPNAPVSKEWKQTWDEWRKTNRGGERIVPKQKGPPREGPAIFGERMAIKADAKAVPIEEMILNRVRGIRKGVASTKDKAATWDKKFGKTRQPFENPYRRNQANADAFEKARPGDPMPMPPDPRSKAQRKSALEISREKGWRRAAESDAKLTQVQSDVRAETTKTEAKFKAAAANAKELRDKLGATSDKAKAAQKEADSLKVAMKNKRSDASRSENLRAAEDVLDQIQGKKPMSKAFGESLDETTRAKYPARLGSADARSKQGELFDVLNTANKAQSGPIPGSTSEPGTVASEVVERVKRKLLLNPRQRDELEDMAFRHKIDVDALAETMAKRQVQGQSAQVVPSVAPIRNRTIGSPAGPLAPVSDPSEQSRVRKAIIDTRNREVLAPDRALKEGAKAYEEEAVRARKAHIAAKVKSGVKVKKEDIIRDLLAVRKEAQRKWTRQMVSEGKLRGSQVRGIPVGTDTPHAREIAFSARSAAQMIMDNTHNRTVMFGSGSPILPKDTMAAIERVIARMRQRAKTPRLDVGTIARRRLTPSLSR